MSLQQVTTESILTGPYRKHDAFGYICDFSRYPEIMESVDNVIIRERDDEGGISEWYVTIEEAPLTWVERDYFERESYRVRFESIDGDLDVFNGVWEIGNNNGEGIKIGFSVEYDLGIPVIEEVLGDILKEKMKTNIDSMLAAIQKIMEGSVREQRAFGRIATSIPCELLVGDQMHAIVMCDFSRGGSRIRFGENCRCSVQEKTPVTIGLTDVSINGILFNENDDAGMARVVYTAPLDIHQLLHLYDALQKKKEEFPEKFKIFDVAAAPRIKQRDAFIGLLS